MALGTGLVLRMLHLWFFRHSPLFVPTGPDELYHHFWALDLAQNGFGAGGVFFRAPLYPYLLGLIYKICGGNLFAARGIGMVGGMVSIWMGWKFTRFLTGSDRAGFIAAMLFAANPVFIYFESRLLLDWLLVPFTMAILIFLLMTDRGWWNVLLAGLFCGIFAVTRPTILLLMPFVAVWLFMQRRKWTDVLILAAGCILPILPVFVSNISHGSPVLISSQGGVNFYIGNNPDSDGCTAEFPGLGSDWQYKDVYRLTRNGNPGLAESDVSGLYFRKGLGFLLKNPGKATGLFAKKLVLLIQGVFIGNNGDIDFYRKASPVLRIPNFSGFIFGFGVLGLVLLRCRGIWLLRIFVVIYSIAILLFFVNTRFKLPLYPVLMVLSVAFMEDIISDKWSLKRTIHIVIAVIASTILSIDFYGLSKFKSDDYHFTLGLSQMAKGDMAYAESSFAKSLDDNPKKRGANLNIGIIEMKKGCMSEAEKRFIREINAKGDIIKAYSNLCLLKRLTGNMDESIHYGRLAFTSIGDRTDAFYNLTQTLREAGQDSLSLFYARQGLEEYPDNVRMLFSLASSHYVTGSDSALYYFRMVLNTGSRSFIEKFDTGDLLQGHFNLSADDNELLARAHFNISSFQLPPDSIRLHLEKAIELSPEFQQAYIQLGNLEMMLRNPSAAQKYYEQALEKGHPSPILAFNYGNLLAAQGQYEQAIHYFNISVNAPTLREASQQRLEAIKNITN